jgi:hypothetical protein
MQQYPDPEQHFANHIRRAADRYADGVKRADLEMNEKLTRAKAQHAAEAARIDYEQRAYGTLINNIKTISSRSRQRDQQIRREGAQLGMKICPPIMLAFGAIAWLNFSHSNPTMGIVYCIGACAFMVMLVYAIRNR